MHGRRQLSFVENDIELFGNLAPVHTVRDLGVMLDRNMTGPHVSACLACLSELLFPNSVDQSIR